AVLLAALVVLLAALVVLLAALVVLLAALVVLLAALNFSKHSSLLQKNAEELRMSSAFFSTYRRCTFGNILRWSVIHFT
ncbi:hypothetical protein VL11_13995, partial [Priestia aryabhattai]